MSKKRDHPPWEELAPAQSELKRRETRHFDKAYEELYIQQRVYDMGLELWPVLANFPREQRFILAQSMRETYNHIRRLIFRANKKYTKKDLLRELDVETGAFKTDLRWANDLGYLKDPQFDRLSEHIVEVGKMVGGWLKAEKAEVLDEEGKEYKCSKCNAVITKRINDYSTKYHGQPLCYACQKLVPKKK